MPNWCLNHHAFFTNDENKNELSRLYKQLETIMETPSEHKNDFEPGWLGKVAIAHGLDINKISCRGWIEQLDDFEPETNYFMLQSETAWSPTDELWTAVVAQYKGVSFVYIAEEQGEEVFINTDIEGIYFPEKYLLEIYGDSPIPEDWFPNQDKPSSLDIRDYFSSFQELVKYCTKVTGKEFSTLEELKNYFTNLFVHEDNTSARVYEFSC